MHLSPPTHQKSTVSKGRISQIFTATSFLDFGIKLADLVSFSDTILPRTLDTNKNTLRKIVPFPIT